jgi:hypothetical protein
MQALQVKATLQGTVPAVYRTFHFHPETGLEQVHDMLLIAMGWNEEASPVFATNDGPITPDDDAYHEGNLNDYLTKAGDLISYGLDSDAGYHVELELIAIVNDATDALLPRVTDGANQAPPDDLDNGVADYNDVWQALKDKTSPRHAEATELFSGIFSPAYFNAAELNDEATELFDGTADSPELDFTFEDDDDDFNFDDIDFTDVDADQDIPFEFAWLEREHGIKVSDGNVHNLPQDLLDYQESCTEDDLKNPRRYLKGLEPLHKKYPDQPMLALEISGLYAITGDVSKARRIHRDLEKRFPDHLELTISRLASIELEADFLDEVSQLPHPLDIRNHPTSNDGYYHTTEFLAFEEVAIREALNNDKLEEARQRLDRLVRFGFLHGDVEQAALLVAGLTLVTMAEMVERGEIEPGEPLPKAYRPVCDRTNAILEAEMEQAAAMFEEMETEEGAQATVRRIGPKVGRNDPCPCGSGKKHKKCCL